MICSKCGQELKEGAKFCTKCGTSFKETGNLNLMISPLQIISIVLTVIGIIGYWVMRNLYTSSFMEIYWVFSDLFSLLIYAGIIIAFIAQNKQKSLFGLIIGIIPCIYLIILQVFYIARYFLERN